MPGYVGIGIEELVAKSGEYLCNSLWLFMQMSKDCGYCDYRSYAHRLPTLLSRLNLNLNLIITIISHST